VFAPELTEEAMSRSKHLVELTVCGLAFPLALLMSGCGASEPTDRAANAGGSGNGSGGSGNVANGSGGSGNVGSGSGGSGNVGSGSGGTGNVGSGSGGGNSGSGGAGGGDPNVLQPPANGLQISTPEMVLAPGAEIFRCFHVEVPSNVEVNVARFVSKMAPGSHHFILYQADSPEQPDGTLEQRGCGGGLSARWVYASGNVDGSLTMPQGVAMPFIARQPLQFDMHYINTGTEELRARVTLNLEFAEGTFERAASLVTFNYQISIPPRTGTTNGTQTVSGLCTPPAGANFFLMSTHTHKQGILAQVRRNSATGEELVRTEDWEHPTAGRWDAPNFLTFAAGEQLYYSCTYENPTTNRITVGTSAETDEMCMAIGYYFPAVSNFSCLGGFGL
jgi:hypothetical protein